jgi:hypothetical protein
VLASTSLTDLLDSLPPPGGLSTHRTADYLRWRYGFPSLGYRAIAFEDDVRKGVAVFRLRRRGSALECALCEVLAPAGQPDVHRTLVRSVARQCRADYVVRLGGPAVGRDAFVHLPGQGPTLTWRPLRQPVPGGGLDDWALALGDVELF